MAEWPLHKRRRSAARQQRNHSQTTKYFLQFTAYWSIGWTTRRVFYLRGRAGAIRMITVLVYYYNILYHCILWDFSLRAFGMRI